jgi:hypothetical protein
LGGILLTLKDKEKTMEIINVIKEEEKQEDIIILDEGIKAKDVIEPLGWVCCIIYVFPYRGYP